MNDVTVLLRTVAGNDRSDTTRFHAASQWRRIASRIDRTSHGHLTCRYARGLMSALAVGFRLFRVRASC